jgi:uncharacterized membrane protein YhaH (DUF805 family)
MRSYLDAFTKYAVFRGRTSREAYWMFVLIHVAIVCLLALIPDADVVDLATTAYSVGVVLPSMAVLVRRMHDVGYSGWWAVVPFASMVIAFRKGERGDNRFGPNPKANERVRFPLPASTA